MPVSKDRGQAPEEQPGTPFGQVPLYLIQNSDGQYEVEPESAAAAAECGVNGVFDVERLAIMAARAASFGYMLSYPGGLT